jgi:hypothetical protein
MSHISGRRKQALSCLVIKCGDVREEERHRRVLTEVPRPQGGGRSGHDHGDTFWEEEKAPIPKKFMLSRKLPRGQQLSMCDSLNLDRLVLALKVTLALAMCCYTSDIERSAL